MKSNSAKVKIKFIVVGKTSFDYLKTGIDEYLKRLKHYAAFEYVELHAKIPKSAKEKEVKAIEGKLFLKHVSKDDFLVLLDENGKSFDSIKFSKWIQNHQMINTKNLVFLVGGPYGFDEGIIQLSKTKISLSPMTFSHQMIRVFFLEQVYRAFTIIKGEPYHHH